MKRPSMHRRGSLHTLSAHLVLLGLTLGVLLPATRADEVTVKGTKLRGRVAAVTSGGIEFETEYGSGTLSIPYDSIEALTTDREILLLYGEDDQTAGRLLGVDDGQLMIGIRRESARRIDVESIVRSGDPVAASRPSRKMRNRWRFWSAATDLGITFEDSTTRESDVNFGAKLEHRKKPTRLVTETRYSFGREERKGDSSEKTDNEVRGLVKGEYDVADRLLAYTSHDFEYDEIDRLSLRWVAKGGPGYRVLQNAVATMQVETGPAYNLERFFGGEREEFFGLAFAAEGNVKLSKSILFEFRTDYLPKVGDWTGDYLIRGQASLVFPITEYLAMKASVFETYDQTPDDGAERNEVKTILSLSWRF